MNKWELLCGSAPKPPEWEINWEIVMQTPLVPYLNRMADIWQNPIWHGEGDVLTHTKMVCEKLAEDAAFRALPQALRNILFAAALMHDIGKIPCTQMEDGVWKSPNHTIVGAKMARKILWRDFFLAGGKEKRDIRECICNLIRFHSVPLHILEQENPALRLHKIAAQGELIEGFTLYLLSILVRADIKGRICDTINESLEGAELCFALVEEENILHKPGIFASSAAEYAYLSGRNMWKGQDIYDDTWGEVILMAGLPGTGKDTWIKEHYANLPMVSLDDIRREFRIPPTENQGKVLEEARERAKGFLRRKQPFVWNATNISPQTRGKQLALFEQYSARCRIVFLETEWKENLARNERRKDAVPEREIVRMMKKLELPERVEARNVEWHCV